MIQPLKGEAKQIIRVFRDALRTRLNFIQSILQASFTTQNLNEQPPKTEINKAGKLHPHLKIKSIVMKNREFQCFLYWYKMQTQNFQG